MRQLPVVDDEERGLASEGNIINDNIINVVCIWAKVDTIMCDFIRMADL